MMRDQRCAGGSASAAHRNDDGIEVRLRVQYLKRRRTDTGNQ